MADKCCNPNNSCLPNNKSIYTGKTDTGKGDKPRHVTKQYEENYIDVFPNSFKPKWQKELENEKPKVSTTKKSN